MQVKIKSFHVGMDMKSRGIEFEVRKPDGSAQIGDGYLTMTGLIWCPGRTAKENGVAISWADFAQIMKSKATRNATLEPAKQA
jgi:hypothetical protein